MADFVAAMTWPLALCLVLGLLLSRLGEELLERRAVFADLAVAQVAGLGALWGALLGWTVDDHPWSIRLFALLFTLLAAALLATQRHFERDLSREALAGALYAFSAAATVVVGAGLHHGAEEARDLLAGKSLFVRPAEVASGAALLALVGLALARLGRRRPPVERGRQAKTAPRASQPSALASDFAFYALLGVAVSYAVPLVGVLLVFGFLLLPPATGALVAATVRKDGGGRRLAAWLAAGNGAVLGCAFAYARDLPLEPSVVLVLGLQLVLAVLVRYLRGAPDRLGASIGVAGSLALFLGLLAWTFQLRASEPTFDPATEPMPSGFQVALVDRLEREPSLWTEKRTELELLLVEADPLVRCRLLEGIGARRDASFLPTVHSLLTDADDLVRESAVAAARALGDPSSADPLRAAARTEPDDFLRLAFGQALLELDPRAGLELLLELMASASVELARREAFELAAEAWPGDPLAPDAFDPTGEPEVRAARVTELQLELRAALP